MADTYQAIYDAVRSKISGGDIGSVIERVARDAFDISWPVDAIKQEFISAAHEMQRPFILLKPPIYPDGDMWCVLLGDDLQVGIAGFGKTPSEAAYAFDEAWRKLEAPPLQRAKGGGNG